MPAFATDNWTEDDAVNAVVDGPIIVGGGPSGLATAACLQHRGIPSIILEKSDCIASLWKYRTYDRIHLHLPKQFCELPLFPINETYPDLLSAAQYIEYLESYACRFRLSPRFNENVIWAMYDESSGLWRVCTVVNSGRDRPNFSRIRQYSSRWLVAASGENAESAIPKDIQDICKFRGNMLHSCFYKNGASYRDCNVLVVGCGNSGMEIALDLAYFGAKPTIAVRGFVHVLPIEMFGMHTYTLISKLLKVFPVWIADKLLIFCAWCKLRSTSKYGLKRPEEGPLSMKNRLGRTPVLDVGTYRLIKKGHIQIRPAVERFTEKGAIFMGGCSEDFDAVVFATGYRTNILDWLFGQTDFFTPEGLPKSRNLECCWKGKKGLYMVGLSGKGIPGVCIESQRIAQDIQESYHSGIVIDEPAHGRETSRSSSNTCIESSLCCCCTNSCN